MSPLLCAVRPRRPRSRPLGAGTPSARSGEYARMARRGRGTRRNGAPSRGPGQLLLDLRSNSPSRALRGGFSPKGLAADLTGPLRQRLTALPPPLKGEAGRVVQMASVGHAGARDSSLRAAPSAQNDRGERRQDGWCRRRRYHAQARAQKLRLARRPAVYSCVSSAASSACGGT